MSQLGLVKCLLEVYHGRLDLVRQNLFEWLFTLGAQELEVFGDTVNEDFVYLNRAVAIFGRLFFARKWSVRVSVSIITFGAILALALRQLSRLPFIFAVEGGVVHVFNQQSLVGTWSIRVEEFREHTGRRIQIRTEDIRPVYSCRLVSYATQCRLKPCCRVIVLV